MKFLLILFIMSLILPAEVRPFEVKKAGRAVPASRLDEIQKSTSKPASDQMTKMQEQILKRMYEQKLAQEREKGEEVQSQEDIVSDVISDATSESEESPVSAPSDELLKDAQGSGSVSEGNDQPTPGVDEPQDISPVSTEEVASVIPEALSLPPAPIFDKPVSKEPIKVKTKDWGEKFAPVAQVYAQVSRDRGDLNNMREKYIAQYLSEREKENPDYVSICKSITKETISYVGRIFRESIEKLGTPPTKFCIFSMGSLAREESGFYTDLEIGILVQEKTLEALDYFKKFSQLISDRLYLLGEHPDVGGKGFRMDEADNSPIHLKFAHRYSDVAYVEDAQKELAELKSREKLLKDEVSALKKKLKNTQKSEPADLINVIKLKSHELEKMGERMDVLGITEGSGVFISTPAEAAYNLDPSYLMDQSAILEKMKSERFEKEFAEAMTNPENQGKEDEIRDSISASLEVLYQAYTKKEKGVAEFYSTIARNLCFLYGDKGVYDEFMAKANSFLDGKSTDQSRHYSTLREEIAFKTLLDDLDRQGAKKTAVVSGVLGETTELKRHIYRYPEEVLTNLSLFYNLRMQNTFDIAKELGNRGLIDKKLADDLADVMNYTIGLRLKKQEHLRSQTHHQFSVTSEHFEKERNSLLSKIQNAKAVLNLLRLKGVGSEEEDASHPLDDEKSQKPISMYDIKDDPVTKAEMVVRNLEFELKTLEKYRPGEEESILSPDEIEILNKKYLPIIKELYDRVKVFVGGDEEKPFKMKEYLEIKESQDGDKDAFVKNRMSLMEAHMNLPGMKKAVSQGKAWVGDEQVSLFTDLASDFSVGDLPDMVQQMDKRAKSLSRTHYDFYHAMPSYLWLDQDVYKALYEFFAIKMKIKDFIFIRNREPIYSDFDSVSDFLKKKFKEEGVIDDMRAGGRLLSVNLSPFGNVADTSESSYAYFKKGAGITKISTLKKYLPAMFERLGLNKDFIPKLRKVGSDVKTETGNFLQIFIPKELVDKIGYLSWKQGLPLYSLSEEQVKKLIGEEGFFTHPKHYKPKLEAIRVAHEKGENVHQDILDAMLDSITAGKNKLSSFLDKYRQDPSSTVDYVEMAQVRLLFTNEILNNPDSGVLVYRYSEVPQEKREEYQRELNQLINEILIDWIERNSNPETTTLSANELDRMKNLLTLMKSGRSFREISEAPSSGSILSHVKLQQELKEKAASMFSAADIARRRKAIAKLEEGLEKKNQDSIKTLWESEKNSGDTWRDIIPEKRTVDTVQPAVVGEESAEEGLSLSSNSLINKLALDMKYYKTTNKGFHAGHLYEHSLWVAMVIERWFDEANGNILSENAWENGPAWIEGIDENDRKTVVLAAFLHDVGKAANPNYTYKFGYEPYFDTSHPYWNQYPLYFAIDSHPEDGFNFLRKVTDYKLSVVEGSGKNRYDVAFKEKGTFDFLSLFKELGISSEQQKIIQILAGCHWDFGGDVVRSSDHDAFLNKLADRVKNVNYNNGVVDERMVRLAILAGAADIRGSRPEKTLSFEAFKERYPFFKGKVFETPIEHGKCFNDMYKKFDFPGKGVQKKNELVEYFKTSWKQPSLDQQSMRGKSLSPFEALEQQRQIREEKLRKGESLDLKSEPKIEPRKISQKRLNDLVDTLEYKKEPLPVPGKLKGEQADVKNQLEKIFGKKSDAEPDVKDEEKPLSERGKVSPAIQKELEKFFASQKQAPKTQPPSSTKKSSEIKPSTEVKKIDVKPGVIPPPPPLPIPSIKKMPAASPAA